jgi:hypothetical protein
MGPDVIRLSVAVMAHRKRQEFIPPLLQQLGLTGDAVVWDERNDRWDTGRRAMLAHDTEASHHLVIQDDGIVPLDLVPGVVEALARVPAGSPMCLYIGKTRRFWTAVARTGVQVPRRPVWLTMPQIHWGVGVVMPTKLIEDMAAWGDRHREVVNYDKRMSRWCQAQGLSVWYPWPSLVDHRQSPSLVAGRQSRGRRAQWFIGAESSAAGRDWDLPVIDIPPFSAESPNAARSRRRRRRGRGDLPPSMA